MGGKREITEERGPMEKDIKGGQEMKGKLNRNMSVDREFNSPASISVHDDDVCWR